MERKVQRERNVQRERIDAMKRNVQRERIDAMGRNVQREQIDAMEKNVQREQIDAMGRSAQRKRIDAMERSAQRKRIDAMGRSAQRKRIDAMGRNVRRKRKTQGRELRRKMQEKMHRRAACCLLLLAVTGAGGIFHSDFVRLEKKKQFQKTLRELPAEILGSVKAKEKLSELQVRNPVPSQAGALPELQAGNLTQSQEDALSQPQVGNPAQGQKDDESGSSVWLLPQAAQCLFTEPEKEELQNQALEAAEQVREVYQNAEYAEGPSGHFYIRNFTDEQRREAAAILGNAGFVSVTADTNMENYEKTEEFYQRYLEQREAMVTIFEINLDGLIGTLTFLYRDGSLQTYYVGVEWQMEHTSGDSLVTEGGREELSQEFSRTDSQESFQDTFSPSCRIKETLVSNIAELKMTEKGYLIYAYEDVAAHASLRQCWRVKPLSDKCRELTARYISGLSYVNYNVLVTNWDSGNAEDILMPCMFEDIYRMDTGEFLKTEGGRIPAELYERVMTAYFPVSLEQVREKCKYEESTASYPHEMIYAVPYPPFGEVVDYVEHEDGSITLYVDGVWADYNSDLAFRNEIVVMPSSDGTFRYLSNNVEQRELELPAGGKAK